MGTRWSTCLSATSNTPSSSGSRRRSSAARATDRNIAGVYEPTGATVQPALLARGLRRAALSMGVRITRAHADDPARPRPAAPRGHAKRQRERGEGDPRHERVVHRVPGAQADHRRGRERHRGDPADARAPRRLGLQRRHVHLGFTDPGELLPPDDGRAPRLWHGRRPALLRQPCGRSLQRRIAAGRRGRALLPLDVSRFQRRAHRDELDRAGRPLPQRAAFLRPPRWPRRSALRLGLLRQRRGTHIRRRPDPRLPRPRRKGRVVAVRPGTG